MLNLIVSGVVFYAVGPRLWETDFALISQILGRYDMVNIAAGHCYNLRLSPNSRAHPPHYQQVVIIGSELELYYLVAIPD